MSDLLAEVGRFREWASGVPTAHRAGEWETEYEHWGELYAAVLVHVAARPFETWSGEEVEAVLYALARDNEIERLADEIALRPALLVDLAGEVLRRGEVDARWQLADRLGRVGREGEEAERLLLIFASDEAEYVRRRALGALGRLGSPAVERLAVEAWAREDEHQEWARMNALDCLRQVGSPLLKDLLAEAERDGRPHLRGFAERLREGCGD